MVRLSLLVLACVSVAFARRPGALDGKNVTIVAEGRALCSGAPLRGTVQLVLFDTQCATCPMPPRIRPFAEAKTDENGRYRIEASLEVPTHGVRGGGSSIYLDLTHRCGRTEPPLFNEWHDQAQIPAEYWNVEGGGRKIFEHDFQEH